MRTQQRQHLSICARNPETDGASSDRAFVISITTAIGVIAIALISGAGFLLLLSLLRQVFE